MLPATPKASSSLIFGNLLKDSLLQNVDSPRIIFIGGSNISFGLNSQMIKDSLNLNPINTGIHANIGLSYMMSNVLGYVRKGDIIILVPEYLQYYDDFSYGNNGGEELARTIFDVNISKIKLLNFKQITNVLKVLPQYSLSKFKLGEYSNFHEENYYTVNSFTLFGDVDKHWKLKRKKVLAYGNIGDKMNEEVFRDIKKFSVKIKNKNALLLVSFPAYQNSSYQLSSDQIKKIEMKLKKINVKIMGDSKRYVFADYLIFNTPYHLTKQGVDLRTSLLMSDLKKSLNCKKKY